MSHHSLFAKADAGHELWQTDGLFGTVFRLRELFVCGKQARRENATRRFKLLLVTEKTGNRKNGSEVHTEFLHHRAH
jgi:hypothetical protein